MSREIVTGTEGKRLLYSKRVGVLSRLDAEKLGTTNFFSFRHDYLYYPPFMAVIQAQALWFRSESVRSLGMPSRPVLCSRQKQESC